MNGKDWLAILGFVLLVAIIVLSVWLWFAGPCWVYDFQRAADAPLRCIR